MTAPFKVALTPNAAADLACDLIDDFVRVHGSSMRAFDVLTLGVAKGQVREMQALWSSGWTYGPGGERLLDDEVARAMELLCEMRTDYEGDTA